MQGTTQIARLLRPGLGAAVLSGVLAWVGLAHALEPGLQPAASRSALSPLSPPANLPPAKIALGERLVHDRRLSGREKLSCSACHDLETGGTVRLPRTIGYDGQVHAFNAPTIFNVGNNYRLGWRGRFTSLAVQNEAVLNDKGLMAANWPMLLSQLTGDETYLGAFRQIYGAAPSRETVLDALVTFQMSLATPDAPFDRFLKGENGALSPAEKEGFRLFTEYGCVSCHQGANIGGNMFQIFGVFGSPKSEGQPKPSDADLPLQATDNDESVFRVPSLRNVEVTAPYFHDGSAVTLRDAIAVMGRSQLGRELSETDIGNLEAFLKSLTGEYNGKRLSAVVTETGR